MENPFLVLLYIVSTFSWNYDSFGCTLISQLVKRDMWDFIYIYICIDKTAFLNYLSVALENWLGPSVAYNMCVYYPFDTRYFTIYRRNTESKPLTTASVLSVNVSEMIRVSRNDLSHSNKIINKHGNFLMEGKLVDTILSFFYF